MAVFSKAVSHIGIGFGHLNHGQTDAFNWQRREIAPRHHPERDEAFYADGLCGGSDTFRPPVLRTTVFFCSVSTDSLDKRVAQLSASVSQNRSFSPTIFARRRLYIFRSFATSSASSLAIVRRCVSSLLSPSGFRYLAIFCSLTSLSRSDGAASTRFRIASIRPFALDLHQWIELLKLLADELAKGICESGTA